MREAKRLRMPTGNTKAEAKEQGQTRWVADDGLCPYSQCWPDRRASSRLCDSRRARCVRHHVNTCPRDRSVQRVEAPIPRPQRRGSPSGHRSLASAKPRRTCRGCPSVHWRGRSAKSPRRCTEIVQTPTAPTYAMPSPMLGLDPMPPKTPLTAGASFGFHGTLPVSLKRQKYPSPEPTMARSRPVASPTTTAAPKQITSQRDRPCVDQISASGPAVPCHTLVPVATSVVPLAPS
jgi:hypothetical protein